MREVGKDVSRNKYGGLAKAVERTFLEKWVDDNKGNFVECMDLIKEGNPVKYAELYLRAVQMGMVRTNLNVNMNMNRQQDYNELQAMVRSKVQKGDYMPFTEIRDKEMPRLNLGVQDKGED